MSGIYIHVPFCESKCGYCDFYSLRTDKDSVFVTNFVNSIVNEIKMKSYIFDSHTISTIYFGGGTPSFLSIDALDRIYSAIFDSYKLASNIECTLEINPEHATDSYFSGLKSLGFVNRLSTGFQAMDNDGLKYLGRRHTVDDNIRYLNLCSKYGFNNFSVDYIFGYEILTESEIERSFNFLIQSGVPHISAYSLGIEEGTSFMLKLRKGIIRKMDDDFFLSQFNLIHYLLESAGYSHYEISNYALDGMYSRHNSSYWNFVPYLGFGPSAHSYHNGIRSWNERYLKNYFTQIEMRKECCESETLTSDDMFNEYVMLRLRTRKGISISHLQQFFSQYLNHFYKILRRSDLIGYFEFNNGYINLNLDGIFISDHIISEFFV